MALISTQTSSVPQPHEVFPASSVVELCGAAVLRTAEDLVSENCGELEQGQACFVLGHGTAPESRRLQVYVLGKGLRGWISCVAKSGRKLVTMTGPPGSDTAIGAAAEFQAIAGAAMPGAYAGDTFQRSGSVSSAAMPAMPACGMQSCQASPVATQSAYAASIGTLQSRCAPAAQAGTLHSHVSCGVVGQSAMPATPACGTMQSQQPMCGQSHVVGSQSAIPTGTIGTMQSQSALHAMPPPENFVGACQVDMNSISASTPAYSRGNSTASSFPSGAGQFPPGSWVAALDEMVVRAEESLKSGQVTVLEEGALLEVLGHGSEPGTRRLYVRHAQSGLCGWISCVAQSGRPLVAMAASPSPEVTMPACAAVPSTRSRSTSAVGAVALGTDSASLFSAQVQESAVERGVSIPMPAASVASHVRISYPPQEITQNPEPPGKQWFRRQKAQDLREEAPKRYLLDNRTLHAGTDGVNYRFTKDLEDIDLSCTALWGSVIEGVDEGDGWLCVSGELYLPMQLAGVTILTLEESPWALAGLQVVEAFPVGSEVVMLEAAMMRAAEDLRSAALGQLEKEQRVRVLGHGAGARNRRLFVQDPTSGQDGWISFVSQTGKLLVTPLDYSPDQLQKVATMISTRQHLESSEGPVPGPSVATQVTTPEEPAEEEPQAFLVDNRTFKADSDGIGYRASPDLEDKVVPARTAFWGTLVQGFDDGEGWLRVGAYFLPMNLSGVQVLTPEAQVPRALLPQLPGFARGDWEYICIDPKGASTYLQPEEAPSKSSSGQAVQPGELVRVCERGLLGQKLWLCLGDGRGWLLEKSSRRHVSEVSNEGKVTKGTKLMVDPRLEKPVKILPAPYAFGAVSGAPEVLAGSVVDVLRQVQVLVPSPSDRNKENWARYYKVEDERRVEGWLGELRVHCGIKDPGPGETVLCEFQGGGFVDPKFRGKSCWVSVVSKNKVSLLAAPARKRATKKDLSPGDFVEAVEELRVAGVTFYRLVDGCWVCREDNAGKVVCDLVVRERHKWIYVCNDKDGAQVRTAPTRSQARNANKKLKYRARVVVSEKVTLSDGDVFLKLGEEKKGWVPATKLNSSVVKMAPLKALEETAAPPSRPMPACNGYAAPPPMPMPQSVNGYANCGGCGQGYTAQSYCTQSYNVGYGGAMPQADFGVGVGAAGPADFGMGAFGPGNGGGDFGLGATPMPGPMPGPVPGPMPGPMSGPMPSAAPFPTPSGGDFGLAPAGPGYTQMSTSVNGWGAPATMAPPMQAGAAWGGGMGNTGYGYGAM